MVEMLSIAVYLKSRNAKDAKVARRTLMSPRTLRLPFASFAFAFASASLRVPAPLNRSPGKPAACYREPCMAKQTQRPQTTSRRAAPQPEIVDPRWLLRTLGLLILLALVCGYLTLGLLFYLGSWQLVLRPTRTADGGTGLPSEKVRFDPDQAGVPQLAGEWLPVSNAAGRGSYAVLFLRSGDGQLDAADGTQIATLHDLGLNVLAFDYRGYGSSAAQPHPSEQHMLQDANAAWTYLTGVRKIAPDHIIVFGSGTGVSLAAQLLQQEKAGAALIGYNADPDVYARASRDPRARLFPLRLVFHDRFPLDALLRLHQPKLLYTVGAGNAARSAVYRTAADPKLTVEVPTHNADDERAALSRFLDENLPSAPATLQLPRMK